MDIYDAYYNVTKIYDEYIKDNKFIYNDPKLIQSIPGKLEVTILPSEHVQHSFKDEHYAINVIYAKNTNRVEIIKYYWIRGMLKPHDYVQHRQSGPAYIVLDRNGVAINETYFIHNKLVTKQEHVVFRLNDIIQQYGRGITFIDNKYSIVDEVGDILYDVDTFEDLQAECEDIVLTMDKVL